MDSQEEKAQKILLAITGIILAATFIVAWNWHDILVWICYWC